MKQWGVSQEDSPSFIISFYPSLILWNIISFLPDTVLAFRLWWPRPLWKFMWWMSGRGSTEYQGARGLWDPACLEVKEGPRERKRSSETLKDGREKLVEVILVVVETTFVKREHVNFVEIRKFSAWPGQWVVGRQWWEVRSTHGRPCKEWRAVGNHWQVFGREVMSRLPNGPVTLVAVWRVIWRGIRKGVGEWVRSLL